MTGSSAAAPSPLPAFFLEVSLCESCEGCDSGVPALATLEHLNLQPLGGPAGACAARTVTPLNKQTKKFPMLLSGS